jgi:DNA-binding NarL/FixJ family response regulator
MAQMVALPSDNDGVTTTGRATRVLVVDDHVIFAQLVERALRQETDLTCVGTASSLALARRMCTTLKPDVVLMDVRLPDGDGVDATIDVVTEDPDVRVVVLSAFIDAALMRRASLAGATALLAKDGDLDDLLHAIRSSEAGSLAVNPKLLHQLVRESGRAAPGPDLTQREREVLRMLAEGWDLTLIAKEMSISVHTCRGHVKNVLAKLGVHSQLQAVVVAMRYGLLEPGMGHA